MYFCIKEHKFGVGSLHWAENRVGYRLNFIDFDSESAYRFRIFSITSFDSNVIK